jgi:uracil-DNA glycosylase
LIQRRQAHADVFFTGLSAVPTPQVHLSEPFDLSTRSGKLVREIARVQTSVHVYYTNLVKCLPLRDDRIRYPLRSELEFCFGNYKAELARLVPTKVVLFGRQVSDFVAEKFRLRFRRSNGEFDFPVARRGTVEYLSAVHPSYVLVYKRRKLDLYKKRIASFLEP